MALFVNSSIIILDLQFTKKKKTVIYSNLIDITYCLFSSVSVSFLTLKNTTQINI